MATYYVAKQHPSASDSNAGTSSSAPWLTVDKAANTVAAGDTVYIGSGVYRELVTMDTSGSSGSSIKYIADIDGSKTGFAGKVIITAHDDDTAVSTRASCLDFNGKTYFEWHNVTFIGGTSFVIGNTAFASATAYEGVIIEGCTMNATSNTNGIKIELNASTTPTGDGIKIKRCFVLGGIDFDWDSNGSAHVNTKILIDGCVMMSQSGSFGFEFARVTNGGAFTPGGVTITNNTIFSGNASACIYTNNAANTTNPIYAANNVLTGATSFGVYNTAGSALATIVKNNVVLHTSSVSSGCTEFPPNYLKSSLLLGGLNDFDLRSVLGYSPFVPFEPMTLTGYTNPSIDRGTNDYDQSYDVYNNSRLLGRPSSWANVYYFDGSDAAASDPNAVWTNEANITDSDITTGGTVATTGSTSSNYVMAEGTNAPGSGGTIVKVQARYLHDTSSGTAGGELKIYTDALAENIGTLSVSSTTTDTWTDWADLTAPTGGWTWAKVQALEFKGYRTSGTGTWRIWQIQIAVITAESAPDIGAVEANPRMRKESTTYRSGLLSGAFDGAGFHDYWIPVSATSTTVSVYGRFDSNYNTSVSKPTLQALNIPGVADQIDTMTSSADTWEELTVTFTPTSAGWVRIRIASHDASTNGITFFDDRSRS